MRVTRVTRVTKVMEVTAQSSHRHIVTFVTFVTLTASVSGRAWLLQRGDVVEHDDSDRPEQGEAAPHGQLGQCSRTV
jgi:hypothetical protein